MRHARLLTFGIAFAIGSTLVACGGGGGGSSTPNAPANPNPGGATPSAAPTGSPSTAPTTGGSPSPSPSPTAATTVGPSSAVIHIGYGQTNGDPSKLLVSKAPNSNGYTGSGDLEPGDPGATTTGGQNGTGGGGQGGSIDGISPQPSMADFYHVHFFLGVFYNGQQVAVPAGVGMVDPHQPNQYVVNNQPTSTPAPTQTYYGVPNQSWTASSYYDLHVHDNSGMIHIETASNGYCGAFTWGAAPNGTPATPPPGQSNVEAQCGVSPWTLQTFFDVWGISIGNNNFGPLTGPVQIYTTPSNYNSYSACGVNSDGTVNTSGPNGCMTNSTAVQYVAPPGGQVSNIPKTIPLQSHTTVWIVVGTPPAGLPSVAWDEGNP